MYYIYAKIMFNLVEFISLFILCLLMGQETSNKIYYLYIFFIKIKDVRIFPMILSY